MVIAIIGVLAAMLLPALQTAKEKGRVAACTGQLRQVGVGIAGYAADFEGYVPPFGFYQCHPVQAYRQWYIAAPAATDTTCSTGSYTDGGIGRIFPQYLDSYRVFYCPGTADATVRNFAKDLYWTPTPLLSAGAASIKFTWLGYYYTAGWRNPNPGNTFGDPRYQCQVRLDEPNMTLMQDPLDQDLGTGLWTANHAKGATLAPAGGSFLFSDVHVAFGFLGGREFRSVPWGGGWVGNLFVNTGGTPSYRAISVR